MKARGLLHLLEWFHKIATVTYTPASPNGRGEPRSGGEGVGGTM